MTIRPKLHFTARSGWINDPHGITVRDGRYHAFFQYVPDSTTWRADCRWGHSIGPDLLTMSERPVAIGPGEGDDGIWTGSLWPDPQGDPLGARIWYTSVRQPEIGIGAVREARPDTADWDRWSKGDVVLPAPPPELGVTAFRDPFVYRDGEDLFALLGAALPDGRAAALRYRIPAAGPWEYLGILAARSVRETEPVWMGALWECPQLVPLGDSRYALITSVWEDDVLHYAGCGIGAYADGVFSPEHWQRLTWGDTHYAPSAFRDSEDRWCLLFWMRDVGGSDDGWAGAHSVPYLIENASSEGIAAGFEAYATFPQDDGYVALSELVVGTYPAATTPDTVTPVKVLAPGATDAGDLSTSAPNAVTDVYSLVVDPASPGDAGSRDDAVGPEYSEGAAGVTVSTEAFDNTLSGTRIGVAAIDFGADANLADRLRVESGKQYKIRFHVTSTSNANRNPQLRLRGRSIRYAWSQKLEIGGALAAGTINNTIAGQSLPGIGCANPDKLGGEANGGWYTMIFHTPMSLDIRPDATGDLAARMPHIAAEPGPGQDVTSRRDLRVGFDLIDTLSGPPLGLLEAGNFTVDRIEIRSYDLVNE